MDDQDKTKLERVSSDVTELKNVVALTRNDVSHIKDSVGKDVVYIKEAIDKITPCTRKEVEAKMIGEVKTINEKFKGRDGKMAIKDKIFFSVNLALFVTLIAAMLKGVVLK